jgi:hypothetical protein
MIVATAPCCVPTLLLFLKTLFDIAMLQKGPEHIPRSMLALLLTIALWLFAVLLSMVVLVGLTAQRLVLEIVLLLFALLCYAGVLALYGKQQRIMQSLAALLGAGSITVCGLIIGTFMMLALFGQTGIQFAVTGFIIWSVSVKGHIMASALDRQWFFGAILASVVFAMQLAISDIFQVQG